MTVPPGENILWGTPIFRKNISDNPAFPSTTALMPITLVADMQQYK